MSEQILHEPVELDKGKTKYDDPELISFIVESRNRDRSFKEIAEDLKERGWDNITSSKVSQIHQMAIARSVVIHNTAKDQFDDFSRELNKMYSEQMVILNKYTSMMRKIAEKFDPSNMEDTETFLLFMKSVPTMKMLAETNLKFLQENREQQDKIIKTTEKAVWSETMMLEYINKYLKTLEKTGQIRILDPALRM